MAKIRLTDKKIEELVRLLCGDDVIPVVRKLLGKENLSEFKLADQLKADIKHVRNVLYRLYDNNLVEFTRKKDNKKGWYIYYWTFKPEQIKFLYIRMKKEQIESLREHIGRESVQQFFICPNNCVRLSFEHAVNFEYHCPECGSLTAESRTEKQLENLKKKLHLLEKELAKERAGGYS